MLANNKLEIKNMKLTTRKLIIRIAVATLAIMIFPGANVSLAQGIKLDTQEKKYSYAIGSKMGEQLLQQFGQADNGIDMQALLSGLSDMASQAEAQMRPQQIAAAIELQQQAQLAAANQKAKAGEDFRATNRAKKGVTETASGIQYNVINAGDAAGSNPDKDGTVVVHYRGTLIDGTEFDSSYSRGEPVTFPLTGIIPGWQEVLQLMRPGDKWRVVIPPELGYGERGASDSIGPNETLVFEIELIEVKAG